MITNGCLEWWNQIFRFVKHRTWFAKGLAYRLKLTRPCLRFGNTVWFAVWFLWRTLFVCLSFSLLELCFVSWSSWKHSAGWQEMKALPGSSLMLPSRRPADFLHGPPSPALPGGLRPAQGLLCDVGCPIKASASWIPRPSFPLSLYLSQRWLRVRAARELGFTLLTQTVSLFASSWLWQNQGGRSWSS